MKIFSKCISCHETGIACTPWGLRTKKGSVAEYLLLLERTEKPVLLLLYGLLTVYPMHFYEDFWWKIAFWGYEITSEVLPRLGIAALLRVTKF